MQIDWRKAIVGGMMGVVMVGCAGGGNHPASTDSPSPTPVADPDARAFHGTIISLRPLRTTMIISKDEHVGKDAFPNEIVVRYNAQTRFLMDGQPTMIDKIRQYMNVDVKGHMRDGAMVAEVADFSSALPKNVIPAPAAAPAAPAGPAQ